MRGLPLTQLPFTVYELSILSDTKTGRVDKLDAIIVLPIDLPPVVSVGTWW